MSTIFETGYGNDTRARKSSLSVISVVGKECVPFNHITSHSATHNNVAHTPINPIKANTLLLRRSPNVYCAALTYHDSTDGDGCVAAVAFHPMIVVISGFSNESRVSSSSFFGYATPNHERIEGIPHARQAALRLGYSVNFETKSYQCLRATIFTLVRRSIQFSFPIFRLDCVLIVGTKIV